MGIVTIAQAASPAYYANDGYYRAGALAVEWFGRGADLWGLKEYRPQQAIWLADGVSPLDGKLALVQNARNKKRFRGQDRTMSPNGDVKVVWGLERDPLVRRAIERALIEACKDTLRFEEEMMLYSRRGAQGRVTEKAVGSIWTIYLHPTSRRNESNPHLHARDYNMVLRGGSWGTPVGITIERGKGSVQSRSALYACKTELSQIFAESLRLRMEALGYRTADASARQGWFTILGVRREHVDQVSSRAKEIVADMKARGVEGSKEAHFSALRTRSAKKHVPLETLREGWIKGAGGWDPASIRAQIDARPVTYRVPDELRARVEAKVQAQIHRTAWKAKSPALDVRRQEGESEQKGGQKNARRRDEKSGQKPERAGDRRAHEAVEKLLRRGKRERSGITRANLYLAAKQVEYVHGTKLNGEEKSRLSEVSRGRGRVQMLGSGSAHVRVGLVLSAARIAFERQNRRVVLVAPTGREASSLGRETGIRSTTASSLIHSLTHSRGLVAGYTSAIRKSFKLGLGFRSTGSFVNFALRAAGRSSLDKKTVLIVVRPTALDVADQAALLKHARRRGARVVFVDGSRKAAEITSQLVGRPGSRESRERHRRVREQDQERSR